MVDENIRAASIELDLGKVGGLLAYHLSIAAGMSLQTFVKMVGGQSRNARYVLLSLIRQNPGVTQAQLSATRFRDKSTLSPVIAEFIADGLVRREKVYVKGRPSQALFLTPAGDKLWHELHIVAERFIRRVKRIMGPEHDQLARLLKMLARGLIELDSELRAKD